MRATGALVVPVAVDAPEYVASMLFAMPVVGVIFLIGIVTGYFMAKQGVGVRLY